MKDAGIFLAAVGFIAVYLNTGQTVFIKKQGFVQAKGGECFSIDGTGIQVDTDNVIQGCVIKIVQRKIFHADLLLLKADVGDGRFDFVLTCVDVVTLEFLSGGVSMNENPVAEFFHRFGTIPDMKILYPYFAAPAKFVKLFVVFNAQLLINTWYVFIPLFYSEFFSWSKKGGVGDAELVFFVTVSVDEFVGIFQFFKKFLIFPRQFEIFSGKVASADGAQQLQRFFIVHEGVNGILPASASEPHITELFEQFAFGDELKHHVFVVSGESGYFVVFSQFENQVNDFFGGWSVVDVIAEKKKVC